MASSGGSGLSVNLFNEFTEPGLMGDMPAPGPGFPASTGDPTMPLPSSFLGTAATSIGNIRTSSNAITDPWPNVPAMIVRTPAHDGQCAFFRGVLCFCVNESGLPIHPARRIHTGRANTTAIITLTDLNRILFERRDAREFQRSSDILERYGTPAGFIDTVSPVSNIHAQVVHFNNNQAQLATVTPFGKARMEYNIWATDYYGMGHTTKCDRPDLYLWLCLVKMKVQDPRFATFSRSDFYVEHTPAPTINPAPRITGRPTLSPKRPTPIRLTNTSWK